MAFVTQPLLTNDGETPFDYAYLNTMIGNLDELNPATDRNTFGTVSTTSATYVVAHTVNFTVPDDGNVLIMWSGAGTIVSTTQAGFVNFAIDGSLVVPTELGAFNTAYASGFAYWCPMHLMWIEEDMVAGNYNFQLMYRVNGGAQFYLIDTPVMSVRMLN